MPSTRKSRDLLPWMSRSCRISSILVAKAFQEVNNLVLKRILCDQKHDDMLQNGDAQRYERRRQRVFIEADAAEIPKSASRLRLPGPNDELTDILEYLSDTSYLRIWTAATVSLLEVQGDAHTYGKLTWT